MAINTIKATIQMRRGAEEHFDPDQMTAGEWAVSMDSKKVWMCFAPGTVRRMATYEAFEEDMQEIQQILATCQDIQEAVEAFEQLAGQHKDQAESYSKTSKSWAVGGTGARAGEDTDNSRYYSRQSASSASSADRSAGMAADHAALARTSADDAAASATGASGSAATATQNAKAADSSAQAAAASAADAEAAKKAAVSSAEESSASADMAKSHGRLAQSYAVGTGGEVRENDDNDSAKGYYEQSRRLAQGFNGIMPMGTITFAGLSDPGNQVPKYMFNISDAFTSDGRFTDGGGIYYGAGNNVVFTAEGKWDALAASAVTGVKGGAEASYRQGNVSIRKEDIGIAPATAQEAGLVKPDGTTTTVDADGTLHAAIPEATIDYDELENRPAINGTVLEGDKALEELGGASVIRLDQAGYDALPDSKLTDGKLYLIEDGEPEGGPVMGVKGAAEEAYRSGYVDVAPGDIGLGNVDDTSDMDKPVSTAQQEALDGKLDKAGGTVSGSLKLTSGCIVDVGRSIDSSPKWVGIMAIRSSNQYTDGTISFGLLNRNAAVPIGVSIKVWRRTNGEGAFKNFYTDVPSIYGDIDIAAVAEGDAVKIYMHTTWYDNIAISYLHNPHTTSVMIDTRTFPTLNELPEGAVMAKRRGISVTGDVTGTSTFDPATGNMVVEAKLTSYNQAVTHRNTFRGKNLGNTFTAAQKAEIANGTFGDLYVGDYWQINGIAWRIVDIDYWLNSGDSSCAARHLVIMPDASLYSAKMNETNTTVGGYVGSQMYKANLENAKTLIDAAFGSSNILNHREHLTNAVMNGYPSASAWYDSKVELPNEIMIYGSLVSAPAGDGSFVPNRYTIDKTQLALMRLYPRFINPGRYWYWLRDVVSREYFARANLYGDTDCNDASRSGGVRPVFGIKG